jgi:hypothetical protein
MSIFVADYVPCSITHYAMPILSRAMRHRYGANLFRLGSGSVLFEILIRIWREIVRNTDVTRSH